MGHILVVDDDKNIRKMVKLTLEKAGHEVVAAEDGKSGLALFHDGEEWDLLLLDQRMPGMAGDEFTREARRRDPSARVMMMTSFASIDLAASVMQAGATDFLRKPFSAEVLMGAVSVALDHERKSDIETPARPGYGTASSVPPNITYYFNGFEYWPINTASQPEGDSSSFTIRRDFSVCSPSGAMDRCTVGVTPHVILQVESENHGGRPIPEFVWDSICRAALSNYLLEKAHMPPTLLPVFELTARQLQDISTLTDPRQNRE